MGDYTKNNVKIGTCGRAYYATKSMLEALSQDSEVRHYLDPLNKCSFAFPFPEYDGKQVGEISNFHEGQRVDFQIKIKKEGSQTFHKHIVHHVHPQGAEGVNLFCDCPYSGEEKRSRMSSGMIAFRLVDQIYYDSNLCIAGECVYCGERNIFSIDEAEEVCINLEQEAIFNDKEAVRPDYVGYSNADTHRDKAIYIREIIKRIKKTYETEPALI